MGAAAVDVVVPNAGAEATVAVPKLKPIDTAQILIIKIPRHLS